MWNETKRAQYLAGLQAGIPIILGFIPVGIAYAIMAGQAGLSGAETVLMSATVLAGASQMMAVGMYAQGAALVTIIVATFVLNLRHLIMSTCVMHEMREAPLGIRLLGAFGVTDETFAMFTTARDGHSNSMFFMGLVTCAYTSWVGGTAIGVLTSNLLPDLLSASLGISLYAMFVAILVPNLTKNLRLALLAVLTAAVNTLLRNVMDGSWALVASTVICAGIGVFFVPLEEQGGADDAR